MTNSNTPARVKLSYSSMKLIQSCEQRYSHYKVFNTPKDSDYTESDALGLGKCYHEVLERTLHVDWNEKLLLEAMKNHNVDSSDADLLRVMLQKYVDLRKASGLRVVKCELGIDTPDYIGFIDAIAVNPATKEWWLIDLKTAGRHDPNLLPQLAKDMQVGLYAHFVPQIEEMVKEVSGYSFAGFKYNQAIKSKASTQKGLENGVKVYEITIPKELIEKGEAWRQFSEVHLRAVELNNGEAPRKNFSACFNYFSSCPYFSKCHNVEFTKGHKQITVDTIDTINNGDFL